MDRFRKAIGAISVGLAGAALVEQLKRPAGSRTWHGAVLGVPYDFRPPTAERVREAIWNPDNPSLVSPTAFGVGWTLNLYRLIHPTEA
jgi:hypothetical protein